MHPRQRRWKRAYTWKVGPRQGLLLLEKMQPFLIIKRKQASVAIEYMSTLRSARRGDLSGYSRRPLSSDERIRRDQFALRIHRLNKKGTK